MESLFSHFTIVIILVTALISFYALNNHSFFEKSTFNPYEVQRKREWWRWVSNGFIHVDYMHLIVNMLTLYFFGDNLLKNLADLTQGTGVLLYVFFYISAIAFSSIYSYYRYRNDSSYNAVGASGAVAAVLFSCILFDPFLRVCPYGLCIPGWVFAPLYLYYEYAMGKRKADNTAHDAHISGAVYGFVFTLVIYPQAVEEFIAYFKN